MVSRRRVLQSIGAATTTGLLAGCVSQGEFSNNGNSSGGTSVSSMSVSTFHAGTGSCVSDDIGKAEVKAVPNNKQRFLLEGKLLTPDPCYSAEVKSATYDAEEDVATVVVTARSTSGACSQCVGGVTYSGAVEFKGAVPGTIRVEHESDVDSATTEFEP